MIEIVDAGDLQVSRRAVVQAPAEVVYNLVADPHRHHELDGSGSVGANISGTERMEVGQEFRTHMKMFGLPYKTTSTVTQAEPNTVLEWQVQGRQKWRWEFLALDDASTQITETWDIRGVSGAKLMDLMMGKKNGKGIEETLRRLQARYAK